MQVVCKRREVMNPGKIGPVADLMQVGRAEIRQVQPFQLLIG